MLVFSNLLFNNFPHGQNVPPFLNVQRREVSGLTFSFDSKMFQGCLETQTRERIQFF